MKKPTHLHASEADQDLERAHERLARALNTSGPSVRLKIVHGGRPGPGRRLGRAICHAAAVILVARAVWLLLFRDDFPGALDDLIIAGLIHLFSG